MRFHHRPDPPAPDERGAAPVISASSMGRLRASLTKPSALAAVAALAVLPALSACASGPGSAPTTGTGTTSGSSAPTPTPSGPRVTPTATATFPADAVGRQLAWMVGQMNTDPVQANVSSRFSATFTQEVPPAQWLVTLGQLRVQAPWVVESVLTEGSQGSASLVAGGRRYRLTMVLDSAGRIDGALIKEAAQGTTATSWPQVQKRATLAAPSVSLLAVDVDAAGRQKVVHRSGEQGLLPIASMVKLYVLAAVAEAVHEGRLAWDRQLTLTSADKTLPSGELQDKPDGTVITVREAAAAMIEISDNTATDLLIRTVGEPAILAAARRAGHTHPEGITPFLSPKQMFWLAYGEAPQAQAARSRWQSADSATRRTLLAAVPMPGPGPEQIDKQSVAWSSGIEWFATCEEIVRAHVYLDDLSRAPALAPLRQILTRNGGLPIAGWTDQAFKGGSDAGVIAVSFLARTSAGRQALVMIGTGRAPVDDETFIAAAGDAATLLAARSSR